ncbi:MAG TPA: sigma-70 family RNA polymerase sigma factor, partial [Polyangiales bacterium]|nr:sigma-70 family RNA polymerase sigma factor [Polyangiales bacterium]
RRARHLLGNDADAYEVVHDVFVSLLERPEQYRATSSLSTFLYSAVTHASLNRIRNQRARLQRLREHWLHATARPSPQASAEITRALRSALRRMPEPLAEVAVYFYMDGLSHEQIAELLGCSKRQVGYHLTAIERWAGREELRSCRI